MNGHHRPGEENPEDIAVKESLKEAAEIYESFTKYPDLKYGAIVNATGSTVNVEAIWSQRLLKKSKSQPTSRSYVLSSDLQPIFNSSPKPLAEYAWSVPSPSNKKCLYVRKFTNEKGGEAWHFEVWSSDGSCKKIIDVTALKKHGQVYEDDDTFGSVRWNREETKVLYVAEKKAPKCISYFDQVPLEEESKGETTEQGNQFWYKEDWGEQLVGKVHPVICVLELSTGTVEVIDDNILDDWSSGQGIWCPDGTGIVFCAYDHTNKLGIVYCPIRRSALFHYHLKNRKLTRLTRQENISVHSPVFSPDGSCFAYLQCEAGGPHCHCMQLRKMTWPEKKESVVVDIVNRSNDGTFFGLYDGYIASRCWTSDSSHVILSSCARSYKEIFAVDVSSQTVRKLTDSKGSYSVIDVWNDLILATFSSISVPTQLVVSRWNLTDKPLNWITIGENKVLEGLKLDVIEHTPQIPHPLPKYALLRSMRSHPYQVEAVTSDNLTYESVAIYPANGQSRGLIILPHGGPHSQFPCAWFIYFAALVKLQYTIVLVNYRGSTGFGEDSINSLPGFIGDHDVKDVQQAAVEVASKYGIDEDKIFLLGGSHGGFLGAHLIGQYPKFYKAAVLRNPVTNLVAKIDSSDIPDWGHVEVGCSDYIPGKIPSMEIYQKLYDHSPIKYVKHMETPTLIMLGENDRRVPPSLGMEFHRALRNQGVESRILVYPQNSHPINSVDAHSDGFMNIYHWFLQHSK